MIEGSEKMRGKVDVKNKPIKHDCAHDQSKSTDPSPCSRLGLIQGQKIIEDTSLPKAGSLCLEKCDQPVWGGVWSLTGCHDHVMPEHNRFLCVLACDGRHEGQKVRWIHWIRWEIMCGNVKPLTVLWLQLMWAVCAASEHAIHPSCQTQRDKC